MGNALHAEFRIPPAFSVYEWQGAGDVDDFLYWIERIGVYYRVRLAFERDETGKLRTYLIERKGEREDIGYLGPGDFVVYEPPEGLTIYTKKIFDEMFVEVYGYGFAVRGMPVYDEGQSDG